MLDGTYDPGLTAFEAATVDDSAAPASLGQWYLIVGITTVALVWLIGAASWF